MTGQKRTVRKLLVQLRFQSQKFKKQWMMKQNPLMHESFL
jgi:hypothetical protein